MNTYNPISHTYKRMCQYCSKEVASQGHKVHERNCFLNPINKIKFRKICLVCNTEFWDRRERRKTCSITCRSIYSNKIKENTSQAFLRNRDDETLIEQNHYRALCFRYHKPECVVCGENNIVEVHHVDGNHSNNEVSNLLPLCPTHHRYAHSEYVYLIEDAIQTYLKEKYHGSSCRDDGVERRGPLAWSWY